MGGYSIPPSFSQCPYSLSSSLSTSFQKSDFESDPSKRSLILGPNVPITVATQVDWERGSTASNFSSIWNSFLGISNACLKQEAGAGWLLVSLKMIFNNHGKKKTAWMDWILVSIGVNVVILFQLPQVLFPRKRGPFITWPSTLRSCWANAASFNALLRRRFNCS